MAKNEFSVELDTGKVVSGNESWLESKETNLYTGWKAGAVPHKSISDARAEAYANKFGELVLGNYNGQRVIDTDALLDMIFSGADEFHGIVVEKVATSRKAITKVAKVKAALSTMEDLTPELRAKIEALLN